MKRKWQTLLSIVLYIVILACSLDFDIFKLIDMRLISLTLIGTVILTVPFYKKGLGYRELLYIFGRKSIETGFIQTFLLLFSRLQNESGYDRLLGDIALCFRPLLYGFCLFILLAEREDQAQSAAAENEMRDGGANEAAPDREKTVGENTDGKASGKDIYTLPEFVRAYGLTRRETEITGLILQGKSNAEIGGELFISETTVKKHVSNIFEKTGINRREELIIKIHGVTPPDSHAP